MSVENQVQSLFDGLHIAGSDDGELIFGALGDDKVDAQGGDDIVFGFLGNDTLSGGLGDDKLVGGKGDDVLIANKGDDIVFGGKDDDLLVWNNGDGSDLMHGGQGYDRVQVNFDTDLVNEDLENKDVAEFSVTPKGVQIARVELNDQTVKGLFQLDIRQTEVLETNFGKGDDAALFIDDILDQMKLDLDGGDGQDLLDFSKTSAGVEVDLKAGIAGSAHAEGFENVVGSEFADVIEGDKGANVISGLGGDDELRGRNGDDTLVANKGDDSVFGGNGNDLIIWNNGDGSDLFGGGKGNDRVQVNFDTDLVNEDLENQDVAEFSDTPKGVQFARVELNDQTVNGLFQLDIRQTEVLETNFGKGDDAALFVDDILDQIKLELDGGGGKDLLDLSQAAEGVEVDLKAGTAGSAQVENFENVIGSEFDDVISGDQGDNVLSGLGGEDDLRGRNGDDTLVANKGDDAAFGGNGNDLLVWNNGDGSDLLSGGADYDRVQVNFDTDLVNEDLENKDVAEFSVTPEGVQFARVELNDQAVNGLFQLDIRQTEVLETNFGKGDDAARFIDDILDRIKLDLDGGDGEDLLDFSQSTAAVEVDLAAGTAGTAHVENFENVVGSDFDDVITGDDGANEIRGGVGNDILAGGDGPDVFVFFQEDVGVDVITDFEFGVDQLKFVTNEDLTPADLIDELTQSGGDVEFEINGKTISIENALVDDFSTDDFLIG
ncbi:MAG: hypothetical protein RIC87_16350 [Kiloniellales bacterium]